MVSAEFSALKQIGSYRFLLAWLAFPSVVWGMGSIYAKPYFRQVYLSSELPWWMLSGMTMALKVGQFFLLAVMLIAIWNLFLARQAPRKLGFCAPVKRVVVVCLSFLFFSLTVMVFMSVSRMALSAIWLSFLDLPSQILRGPVAHMLFKASEYGVLFWSVTRCGVGIYSAAVGKGYVSPLRSWKITRCASVKIFRASLVFAGIYCAAHFVTSVASFGFGHAIRWGVSTHVIFFVSALVQVIEWTLIMIVLGALMSQILKRINAVSIAFSRVH